MPNPTPLNPPVLDRSRSVVRYPVELATHLGLKLYNRTFPRLEAALYLAEVIVHLQGRASRTYAEEIDQVKAAITQELERLANFATGEARHVGKLAKGGSSGASSAEMDIRYTQAIQVDLAMRTPQARRYAALLAEIEKTGRALDVAWYAGALDSAQRLNMENILFRNCMRSCGVIERLARGLARRVRDDAEAPGYRDMLIKRTGRGPDAASAPVVAAEGRTEMTAEETASLQATEALASTLLAVPEAAGEAAASVDSHEALVEDRVQTETAHDRDIAATALVAAGVDAAPHDAAATAPPEPEAESLKTPPRRRVRDLAPSASVL